MGQEKVIQNSCVIQWSKDYRYWVDIPNSEFGPPNLRICFGNDYISFNVEPDKSITIRSTLSLPDLLVQPLAANSIKIRAARL